MAAHLNGHAADSEMDLIFHGTGTSSGLPLIECLVLPPGEDKCPTCTSSQTSEGRKNFRRNTGAIIRARAKDGEQEMLTIVIDVGKTFMASALEWFPKYNLRKIDAVLITHAHADAVNGLDDLRGWTLRNAIQPHIDVYLTSQTFTEVNRSFPYLVDKSFGSGGGDLPDFQWHIIEGHTPFIIRGLSILPFPVHHGRLFTTLSTPPAWVPTPPSASTPTQVSRPPTTEQITELLPSITLETPTVKPKPYICLGFAIEHSICWISDVSYIPPETWKTLQPLIEKGFAVLVVDCLGWKLHASHFGIKDAVLTASRIGATSTYLIGFGHEIPHDDWTKICQYASGDPEPARASDNYRVGKAMGMIDEADSEDFERNTSFLPCFDGQRLHIKGREVDDTTL